VPLLLAATSCTIPSAAEANPELVIYNDDAGENLLHQCSRGIPPAHDGRWDVRVADVSLAEQALVEDHPEILRQAGLTAERFRDNYAREAAGFTRGGTRYLYISYGFVAGMVCDSGPGFFGVEFAMPSAEVTHTAYNGVT